MRLINKVAIITGAALGYKEGGPSIGSSIAFKFASEGAKIVAIDINEVMVKKTVDKIISSGGHANVACFLASEESSYINGECIQVDSGRSISDTHNY